MGGFIVFYRWSVPAEQEEAFRERWRIGTREFRDNYGGLGSCLTRTEDGEFVAIAAWPSEHARTEAFGKMAASTPLPGVVLLGETRLQVDLDLWTHSPFKALQKG